MVEHFVLQPKMGATLQELAQRAEAHDRAPCVGCGATITVDNKSPVPQACAKCWREQEQVMEVEEGDVGQNGSLFVLNVEHVCTC